VKRLTSW